MVTAPAVPALQYYQNVIGINETYMANITARAESCGYTDFFDKWTNAFPPPGPIPTPPNSSLPGCDLYDDIYNAIYYVNPCFNIYHLIDSCPYPNNELGFPSLGGGPNNYVCQIPPVYFCF
jgi:carboxypeptidase D